MQQEMQHQPQNSGGYEGEQTRNNPVGYYFYGQKLSAPQSSLMATAGQRLALAVVSLSLFLALVFGLIAFAAADNAPNWTVIPILFVIVLFSAVVTIINVVFNRRV